MHGFPLGLDKRKNKLQTYRFLGGIFGCHCGNRLPNQFVYNFRIHKFLLKKEKQLHNKVFEQCQIKQTYSRFLSRRRGWRRGWRRNFFGSTGHCCLRCSLCRGCWG